MQPCSAVAADILHRLLRVTDASSVEDLGCNALHARLAD